MLKLKKIAITGGVASGKTTVCRYFQQLGAFTVSTDAIVHELLADNDHLKQQIIQKFGVSVLRNGSIDRAVLASKVFQDPEQLDWLERLVHPMVLQKMDALYVTACASEGMTAFVVEIPLLFEVNWAPLFDATIAIIAEEQTCKKRFAQNGYTTSEYDRRMSRQLHPHQKAAHAHFTIQNNGTLEMLFTQAKTIYQKIISNTQQKVPSS